MNAAVGDLGTLSWIERTLVSLRVGVELSSEPQVALVRVVHRVASRPGLAHGVPSVRWAVTATLRSAPLTVNV
jgi:hypothetical protein